MMHADSGESSQDVICVQGFVPSTLVDLIVRQVRRRGAMHPAAGGWPRRAPFHPGG